MGKHFCATIVLSEIRPDGATIAPSQQAAHLDLWREGQRIQVARPEQVLHHLSDGIEQVL